MIPDVAIGAVTAALIGAIISLVGLIVAKESKVSEFRQSWIDALRSELSAFLTNANSVASSKKIEFKSEKERLEFLQPSYEKLNEAYYSIALRLNSTEMESRAVQSSMVLISKYIIHGEDSDFSHFNSHRIEFVNNSNALLKKEWNRVKSGEKTYRVAKWVAAISTIALIATALLFATAQSPSREAVKEKARSVAAKCSSNECLTALSRGDALPRKEAKEPTVKPAVAPSNSGVVIQK